MNGKVELIGALGSVLVSGMPGCVSGFMPVGMEAIAAQWVSNEPGMCAAMGGEPIGEMHPINPSVYCCQPLPTE
ncbi:hypothetical protein [Polyangium spumosum]|uniref:Uncharacterized protein n=1 Tax=Polyangium spumosum TaxID=889282 RepID=A0A6N7QCC1_9BACT|nr:hypothetical protein [Polyangium spumosum]MRG98531.1 hypothetical protein [Polyangium spumosum]